ncbi:MAG: hypothetical protein J6W64_10505 [Bacilli bacterium]|nr:hypothetical protein [Bacilli bacterium]
MRKQTIIKIIITILLLSLCIVSVLLFNKYVKDKAISKEIGKITIELIDFDGTKSQKEFSYKEGDSIWPIIKDNYRVEYTETQFGIMLIEIDDIITDFTTTYIAIYVNDEYSNYTISNIPIKDGLFISLRATYL